MPIRANCFHSSSLARTATVGLLIGLIGGGVLAQTNAPIDWQRAKQLYQRRQAGEPLTEEEAAYVQRAMRERQRHDEPPLPTQGKPSMGIKPLSELGAQETYKGESGGLYGNDRNEPPEALRASAAKAVGRIQPLDKEGRRSANGRIVLISIGMSNTTQEFSEFVALANRDPEKSPPVVVVDGAQGGRDAPAWAAPREGRDSPWDVLQERLVAAGVTSQQVQVAWIKQAIAGPARLGEFPQHAKSLEADLAKILNLLQTRYPNVRIAYLSSRIYAGYASTPLNPEPYAYESAFAVRWLVRDQNKDETDMARGPGDAPLALWGPYLWADGQTARKADGLAWNREDFAGDGTHPSTSGRHKVAEMLLRFFKTDPSARVWFVRH